MVPTVCHNHHHQSRAPFYQHGLTLIPALISNYMRYEITYAFPDLNHATVEVLGMNKLFQGLISLRLMTHLKFHTKR